MRTFLRKLAQLGWSFPILLGLLALCIGGIIVIMSATYTNEDLKDKPVNQAVYLAVGFVVYLTLAFTPYKLLVKIAPILYLVGVFLLIACFLPGLHQKKVYGAHSWVQLPGISFEPAEFVKLATILFLAWFLRVREHKIKSLTTVLMALGITFIPFILIKEQPAFGTASVFFPICICMLFAAGARLIYIFLPLGLVAAAIFGAYYWFHVWNKGGTITIFKHDVTVLKDFQVSRIKVFFDPSLDPKDKGWQISQSLVAIGTGGIYGKGWRQGTQNVLGYLPKNTSYNDLIFSVLAEDFGFRGGAALILGQGTILLWCLWVAAFARDKLGALVAVGVMAMLFTHIFVNVGMTIQVVPITGIPLPFVSYGGTFLVTCLAAMGLVQSVWVHRKNFERT